jgi:hypothetical protein
MIQIRETTHTQYKRLRAEPISRRQTVCAGAKLWSHVKSHRRAEWRTWGAARSPLHNRSSCRRRPTGLSDLCHRSPSAREVLRKLTVECERDGNVSSRVSRNRRTSKDIRTPGCQGRSNTYAKSERWREQTSYLYLLTLLPEQSSTATGSSGFLCYLRD